MKLITCNLKRIAQKVKTKMEQKFYVLRFTFQSNRGFTLVETLVAIFVLMIAIIAPMSIASQALSTARHAKDQVTASYLAQEGVELVRNIRDNNVLSSTPIIWNEGSLGVSALGSETHCYSVNCKINPKDLSISDCSGNVCEALSIDTNGIYGYSGTPTPFSRKIFLKMVSSNEISVSSTVSWTSGGSGISSTITLTDTLFNWP